MFNVVRLTLLKLIPTCLLKHLPTPDLRRDVAWGMVAVGVFMLSLGRFGLFGDIDTRLTATVARVNVEAEWGLIMLLTGLLQCFAAFLPWRVFQVAIYGTSGLVLIWTYVITGFMHNLNTPIVHACLGIGVTMLIGAVAKAKQSVLLCAKQRRQNDGRAEYG